MEHRVDIIPVIVHFGGYFTRALLHVGHKHNCGKYYTQASINGVLHHVPSVYCNEIIIRKCQRYTYWTGKLQVPFAFGVPGPKYRSKI
jgi:hypothetical protein